MENNCPPLPNEADDEKKKKQEALKKLLDNFELLEIERSSSTSVTPDILVIKDKRTDSTLRLEATCLAESKTFFKELLQNRCTVGTEFHNKLRCHINALYEKVLLSKVVTISTNTLGWFKHGDDDLFLLSKEQECNGHKYISTRDDFKFQSGNADEYQQLLDEVVYPNNNLSLALAIGYSAVVVARLKGKCGFGALLFNFSGTTSTGKTTVEKLLISPFASPTADGLLSDFHSTENGLYARLNNIYGLPVVFDDITTNESINKNEIIYSMADSKPKARCTTDGSLSELSKASWSGVIVISSESPILYETNENQGQYARVISLDNIGWTPDAQTAERIQRVVSEHYGFTGAEFAEYVKSIPIDELFARYETARQSLPKIIPNKYQFADRLEKQYAAIYLTIQLVNECFNKELQADNLLKILLNAEAESLEEYAPEEEKALLHIKQFFLQHRQNFYYTHSANTLRNEFKQPYFGQISINKKRVDLYVLANVLNDVLGKHGINKNRVRKKWRDTGLTKCDKNSTSTTRKNLDNKSKCHVHFVFDKSNGDDLTWLACPNPFDDLKATMADNDTAPTTESQKTCPNDSAPLSTDNIDFSKLLGGDTDSK